MNAEDVVNEIAQGVSPVCATCSQYWRGRELGFPRPKCATLVRCGSPIAGDTFSQYEGIITDFGRWCFVCAAEAEFAVQVRDDERLVGICKGHVRLLTELEASEQGTQSPLLSIATGRTRLPLLQLVPPPKKGLFQAIAEMEAGLAADGQR